jgi:signal transduction histidine kinase
MFYSLRFGILLAMFAIAAVSIATITIFVGMATRAEFSRYVEVGREIRQERVQQAVVIWTDPDANGIPEFDELSTMKTLTDGTGLDSGNFRFLPLGTFGMLEEIESSTPLLENDIISFEVAPDGSARVMRRGETVGTLYVDPVSDLELQPAQNEFMDAINWTLLLTAIVAGFAAIALTVILSRRILHPVAALTLAARRMERGDLGQRVSVHATGEIGELAHAFNAMSETLNKNEELRRSMVTDIAHELRTPLTNIRGYLEAIQDGVLAPDDSTIALLHEETMMLNRLIQDLQELALAEAGALDLETQPVALQEVIEQALSASQATAASKAIRLIAQLPAELPAARGDYRRVAQILRNLINNAITHTASGGEVLITAEVLPNEINVLVKDTGEGIASEHLPYLFERFYRVDPSRSRSTGGAGLGLAIVKQLVEAQGGRVQVDSIRGSGSTFSFTLPLYRLAA